MKVIKITLKIIVMLAVFTALVMLLWNWLIPGIFNGPAITYVQALGLLLLSKILLSPIGRGFGHGGPWRAKHRHWKQFEERMHNMTEEERAKFKEKFEHFRC